jgi:hypothetical protein
MSSSKWLVVLAVAAASTASCAATQHHYECPASLDDGQVKYPFKDIDVFDGPPKNMASLIPAETKDGVRWDFNPGGDIYFVCGYKGTDKTVTVHAPGVTVCKGTQTPLAAFCD